MPALNLFASLVSWTLVKGSPFNHAFKWSSWYAIFTFFELVGVSVSLVAAAFLLDGAIGSDTSGVALGDDLGSCPVSISLQTT